MPCLGVEPEVVEDADLDPVRGQQARLTLRIGGTVGGRRKLDRHAEPAEVAHGGQLVGRGELHRVLLARAGRIRNDFVVRDCDLPFVGYSCDVERRFVVGFIKRGKGAAGIGGFKL